MNEVKVGTRNAILGLHEQGKSQRYIARELGVNRRTVQRHIRLASKESKCANPTAGTDRPSEAEFDTSVSEAPETGPPSKCKPFRKKVLAKIESGLTAQRIFQDLRDDQGFTGSYESVKRYCRRLGKTTALPFRRMETEPGEEVQVDFGRGAPVRMPNGKTKRPHLFRIVLSFSRKAYCEVVWRTDTETFIRCLENAFRYFGGVPKRIITDNLKAAVIHADWFDPDLNPKIEAFCRHYGSVVLPTKPRMPRHKGKVESSVDYVQENALKGRVFDSLEAQNDHLLEWEASIADVRIHGTTRRQVKALFEEHERKTLLPLTPERFPFFHEGERTVHRDGHAEVDKSYYSVPEEYLGRRTWVRWDSQLVRIFNTRLEQIALHTKKKPGEFSTDPAHISSSKISSIELGATALLRRASLLGPNAARWGEAMLKARGVQGMRVLQGLLSLAKQNAAKTIDTACELALGHGAFRLREVRALMKGGDEQVQLEFMSEHPVIRNMNEYGRIVKVSFEGEGAALVPLFDKRSVH